MRERTEVFDLARLVRPIELLTLFSEYWDRRPLLVKRGDPGYFRALFRLEELDSLLGNYGVPTEFNLRLVKRGGDPATILLPPDGPPSVDRIYAAFRDGYTVNVNDLATHHPAIRRMTHAVLAEVGAPTRANLFLTPAGEHAFDLHFDTHEVMILQLDGEKAWRVFDRVEEQPTPKHSDGSTVPREAVGKPLIETTLEAGDVLYVPRGFVHEAHTESRFSLHITLGMRMGTYLDLLTRMLEHAGWTNPKLRASIPPGAIFGRSRAEIVEQTTALLGSELGEHLVDEALAGWAAHELSAAPSVENRRFGALAAADESELTLDEPLHKPAGLLTSVSTSAGRAFLHFQRGNIDGPWRIRPALDYVAGTQTLRARDLPSTLSDKEKLVLVKRLVLEGVLLRGEKP